jgi:hypothetical protein
MIEQTFHTPGGLTLDLSIPSGTVEVETVDGDQTHVRLECDDETSLEDARVELRGDRLVVEAGRKRRGRLGGIVIQIGDGGRDFRLHLTCPHDSALRVRTAGADVSASGRYRSAEIKSLAGDIELAEVSGDAAVKTVSGDVRIGEIGGALNAQLVSGDLLVRDARGSANARSVSGDQRLQLAEGEANLASVSGDIEVAIQHGSRVHVNAHSVSGRLDSELELGDAPGDGDGPMVELSGKTVSGSFRVTRATPSASPAAAR